MQSVLADSTDLRDYVQVYQNLLAPDTCEQIIAWAEQQPDASDAWDGWEVAKAAVSNTQNEVTKHRKCHFTMMNEHRGVCVEQISKAIQKLGGSTYISLSVQSLNDQILSNIKRDNISSEKLISLVEGTALASKLIW